MSRWAVNLLLAYLGTLVLESVLRWMLSMARLEALFYLRDLLPIGGIVCSFLASREVRRSRLLLVVALQLAFATLVGFYYCDNVVQAALGLKAFVPMVFGLMIYPSLLRHWTWFAGWCAILLGVTVTGMVLNPYFSYPWIGADFTAFDKTMELSREWAEIDGRDRLPGFSRAASEAAAQIIPFCLFSLYYFRKAWVKILLAVASLYAIYLTTAKASVACLPQMLLTYAFLEGATYCEARLGGAVFTALRMVAVWALRLQIAIFTIAVVLLPTLTGGTLKLVEQNLREDSQFHLLSIQDRAATFWPLTWEYIYAHGSRVLGTGIGGIGSAQDAMGGGDMPITADNTFLYLYAEFGVAIYFYLAVFLWAVFTSRLTAQGRTYAFALLALSICVRGISETTIESPCDCVFLGLMAAHLALGNRLIGRLEAPVPIPAGALELAGAEGSATVPAMTLPNGAGRALETEMHPSAADV